MRLLSKLTLNQKLGLAALGLGTLALFANVTPGRTAKVNAAEVLTAVERQEDHVTPTELAAWIIEGRADYRLIDLRHEQAFAAYHIPGAVNVPLASVLDGALVRTDKLVLYAEDGVHSAQAWLVLKGRGFARAYTLAGGLEAWREEVLFPALPQDSGGERQAQFEKAVQVARFFGGQPRATAGGGEAMTLPVSAAAPAVAAPVLPAGAGAGPKKRREGC